MKTTLVLALAVVVASDLCAADAISEKNWVNHPAIVEVRTLYQATKALQDSGRLDVKKRKFEYCEPGADAQRFLYTDRDGRPRVYRYAGGSDDSSVSRELYYGEGILRFALITAGAVNGTEIQHRVYFSRAGTKIWEIQKRLKGPGYFPSEWPESDLIRDPVRAFNAESPCPETR